MSLRKDSTKVSVKRAQSSRSLVPSNSKTCSELRRRTWHKRLYQVSFLLKVVLVYWLKSKASASKTICDQLTIQHILRITIKLKEIDRTILIWASSKTTQVDQQGGAWLADQGQTKQTRCISSWHIKDWITRDKCQSSGWRVRRWISACKGASLASTSRMTPLMVNTTTLTTNTMDTQVISVQQLCHQ